MQIAAAPFACYDSGALIIINTRRGIFALVEGREAFHYLSNRSENTKAFSMKSPIVDILGYPDLVLGT